MKSDPPGEPEYDSFGVGFSSLHSLVILRRAVLEAITVVACFDDMAMMGEPVQQRRGHLRVAEHTGPLREAQIGRNDDAGALRELAEQVEQQRSADLAERQVAQFIEYNHIDMDKTMGHLPWFAGGFLVLQDIDQFDGREAAHAPMLMHDRL